MTKCYDRQDWLSFWITLGMVLVIYLYTLAPEVTLGSEGAYATGAMYASGSVQPGDPFWAVYAWLFIHLLPVSNVAWRIGFSSAFAGAAACGMVALMVSRGGGLMLKGSGGLKRLTADDEKVMRAACGAVSGMCLGFHRAFWHAALVADSAAFSMAVFCLVLCLLLRWFHTPNRRGFLYTACFCFGLTLNSRICWVAAAPGLPLILYCRKRALGRDILFVMALVIGAICVADALHLLGRDLATAMQIESLKSVFLFIGAVAVVMCLRGAWKTGGLLTCWRPLVLMMLCLACGLAFYFYIPVASMTNPPMNWGYPRTIEGFLHTVSRGQYESFHSMIDDRLVIEKWWNFFKGYLLISSYCLGWMFLVIALVPLICVRRMNVTGRRWIVGMYLAGLIIAAVTAVVLNPPEGYGVQAFGIFSWLFIPTHVVPAILFGYGLILVGTLSTRTLSQMPHLLSRRTSSAQA